MHPCRLSRLSVVLLFAFHAQPARALDWPGEPAGSAYSETIVDQFRLQNHVIGEAWSIEGGKFRPVRVGTLIGARSLDLTESEVFRIILENGQVIAASDLRLAGQPHFEPLRAHPSASVLAERLPGQRLTVHLAAKDGNLQVTWHAVLREGANALRQEFEFRARTRPIEIKELQLVDVPRERARVVGSVPGSPILVGNIFFAYEHPDAQTVITNRALAVLRGRLVLDATHSVRQTTVVGVAPWNQLRRGFLYYVERERAHPYRPFLHYNAWYDICWGDRKINEAECLDVIERCGAELFRDRGLPLASYVWDDGWDDPKTLWRPIQTHFPNGFSRILAAARQQDSTLGFWLSPFGGHGQAKEDRLAMGKAEGFESGPQGFSLAGPRYYQRFLETCSNFVDPDGANFFKFDGLTREASETEAMLRLTRALRQRKPDVFISITTGTWPSPFWLGYGDSIWRGGDDMGFAGPGPKREQWITYRDQETYRNIVRAAPFYPLNSVMTQGFVQARQGMARQLGSDPDEIRHELRSFFASGTCLQELYITPAMMSAANWDDLAECAKWSRTNQDVLVDTHWIGGDPGKGEPYGWASWSDRKAILALRNPSDQARTMAVDLTQAFELSRDKLGRFSLKSPWKSDLDEPPLDLRTGEAHSFALRPFEVLVLDASPVRN
jgi:hypothetical protein